MIQNLKEIYEGQARQERYETSKALFQYRMSEGSPVGAHFIKMMGYIQTLEKLGFTLNDELAIDVVLQSLPDSFNQFVLNFNMNEIKKTLPQLLGMLRTAKSNKNKNGSKSVLMVRVAKRKGKKVAKSNGIGKMTKALFNGKGEQASYLLGLIHSDVCGPMNAQARGGFQYFITFTDDFSRYGYIYLMRHKSEVLEKFKEFKNNEVQNQHGKSIKALRSDRGGEYLSQDFDELLKECGIISQLTPPGTPQWNGVSERINRTLLDMVRSMMIHTDLPTSFWGYALETAAFTLNRVPSKSVQKTPHEMWTGKHPKHVFYEETQPLRRSTRECHEPERYRFLVTTHGDVILVDQDEPKTYQEAVSSPDSEKWLEAMRSKMDSMSENQVWTLVKPTEGIKPIGCKWVFKKKTDMDGNIQTYKGQLVAKGFRQIHGVDYDETFSPVAMFKSIQILLSIAAFHDYEIWKMDIKTLSLMEN
ncbi:hypothetical protein V6N11_071535 [Hibiscus sabdariffa]|uniref:Integrase catalytic domain-containing protein n=1 Tax=Hibiscus sabdariffa TaxID=183260 RepID=A0ABR2U0C9_9ROSI